MTRERILVATDLSAHSDRAFDRATLLARERGAELVVLHVIEPSAHGAPATARAAVIRGDLVADLGAMAQDSTIRVERGSPATVIERVAREERCHVIVVGRPARGALGRWSLGRTVGRLLRVAEVPVLIATDRPRGPYRRVAVATDFSAVSAVTVQLAAALFPQQRITLFHAYEPAGYGSGHRRFEHGHQLYDEWLARSELSTALRSRLDLEIGAGDPAEVLRMAADRRAFDVLVLGTRGHTWVFELLLGSVSRRIVAELPCDALYLRSRAPAHYPWRVAAKAG